MLWLFEKLKEAGESSALDEDLGLDVVPGRDIAHGPEGSSADAVLDAHEELHQPPAHAAVHHSLDPGMNIVLENRHLNRK